MMGVADVPIDIFKTKSSKIPKASPKVDANKPASTVSQPEPDKAVDGLERGQPHGEDHGKEASSNQLSSEGTIKASPSTLGKIHLLSLLPSSPVKGMMRIVKTHHSPQIGRLLRIIARADLI